MKTPVDPKVYPRLDAMFDDLGQAYRKAVRDFAEAGCRYLQLDEVFIAMLCDEKYRAQMTARGDDPDKLGAALRRAHQHGDVGHSLRHDDHHAHVPRQLQSTYMGMGGYEEEQEILSARSRCTATSWNTTPSAPAASSRCGVPKDRQVVLGLVTTKTGSSNPRTNSSAASMRRRSSSARAAVPVAAMRLRLDRGGQHAHRGGAVGEAQDDCRGGAGGLGVAKNSVHSRASGNPEQSTGSPLSRGRTEAYFRST